MAQPPSVGQATTFAAPAVDPDPWADGGLDSPTRHVRSAPAEQAMAPTPALPVVTPPAAVGRPVADQVRSGSSESHRARRGPTGRVRNPWGVWLLVLLTLGLYGSYWYWKVNDELRTYDPSIRVNPAGAWAAIAIGWLLCFIPTLVSWFNTGSRVAHAQRTAGIADTCSGGLGLLCHLVPGGGYVYYQVHLNTVWEAAGRRSGPPPA